MMQTDRRAFLLKEFEWSRDSAYRGRLYKIDDAAVFKTSTPRNDKGTKIINVDDAAEHAVR